MITMTVAKETRTRQLWIFKIRRQMVNGGLPTSSILTKKKPITSQDIFLNLIVEIFSQRRTDQIIIREFGLLHTTEVMMTTAMNLKISILILGSPIQMTSKNLVKIGKLFPYPIQKLNCDMLVVEMEEQIC